jgi:hypothetical protein
MHVRPQLNSGSGTEIRNSWKERSGIFYVSVRALS